LRELKKYYKVSEIFLSIQGEGLQAGLPMLFIRFGGCNLRCDFCDTKYAFENYREMTISEIKQEIKKFHKKNFFWVSFTGGEPFLQDLSEIFYFFKNEGFKIHIETNGTLWQDLNFDWISFSPKILYKKPLDIFFEISNEIKLVVWEKFSEEEILYVLEKLDKCKRNIPVFLQPDRNKKEFIEKAMDFVFKIKDCRLRLGFQLHRYWAIK